MATTISPANAPAPSLAHNENVESFIDAEAEAPPLSTPGTLARFEFENGKGNEGTKVLMVEWISPSPTSVDSSPSAEAREWDIRWENKKPGAILEAFDRAPVSSSPSTKTTTTDGSQTDKKTLHKCYILLFPHIPIPRLIKIISKSSPATQPLQANPLPAIYTGSVAAGTKGILHTAWAKARLEQLETEIEREGKENAEGIALVMALEERSWIRTTFLPTSEPAVAEEEKAMPALKIGEARPLKLNTSVQMEGGAPMSPRTPGGGRLAEKLKGLNMKLGTSDAALAAPTIRAHAPPDSILQAQGEGGKGFNMDAVLSNGAVGVGGKIGGDGKVDEEEKELFSVALSPRSPDMTRSPFSLRTADVVPWR